MRNSVAKTLRRSLVPAEKLNSLSEDHGSRVSRGGFMRATTNYVTEEVMKSTTNPARKKYVFVPTEDGKVELKEVTHQDIKMLGECPRKYIQKLKEKYNVITRSA